MRRGLVAAVLILFALLTMNSEANAQMRRYSCGENALTNDTVTVTDIADRMLSAGPLRGQTFKFRQSTNDAQSYISGSYILRFSEDQSEIEIAQRGVASVACTYEVSVTATAYNTDSRGCLPGTQPSGNSNSCTFVLSDLLGDSNFVGSWRQKSGNAECEDCTLVITRSIHGLIVVSNTGWAGIVNRMPGGKDAAGHARFVPGAGSIQFAGKTVGLDLRLDGDTLDLRMTGRVGGKAKRSGEAPSQLLASFERMSRAERQATLPPPSLPAQMDDPPQRTQSLPESQVSLPEQARKPPQRIESLPGSQVSLPAQIRQPPKRPESPPESQAILPSQVRQAPKRPDRIEVREDKKEKSRENRAAN
jgi:hypothetical protein